MRRIPWFIAGIITAVIVMHGASYYADDLPRGRTVLLPEATRSILDKGGLGFLRNAYHTNVASFNIYRPSTKDDVMAYATFGPPEKQGNIIFFDKNSDGFPEELVVADKAWHHVELSDKNNDGTWEQWSYSLRPNKGITYTDTNMDGQPDISINLETEEVSIYIGDSWRTIVKKNGKKYVQIGKELKQVVFKEGKWTVIAPNQAL